MANDGGFREQDGIVREVDCQNLSVSYDYWRHALLMIGHDL